MVEEVWETTPMILDYLLAAIFIATVIITAKLITR